MDTTSRQTRNVALVVDDDALIRMDAAGILEDAGFETLEAGNVDEALAILRLQHPVVQVLFTDVQMPGERDGFSLAREAATCWPHIAIVVASGHVRPGPADLPDCASFIPKPFSAAVVRHHLGEMLPEAAKPAPLRHA